MDQESPTDPTCEPKVDKKKKKTQLLQRQAMIKGLTQRICTPVPAEKRASAITAFFKAAFINSQVDFTEEEYLQIWKALFYAVWYSEMNKGCEKVIEAIVEASSLNSDLIVSGFTTLKNEWSGIDNIRLDKFAYLLRRMVSRVIQFEITDKREGKLLESVLSRIERSIGLLLQVCSVFVEEAFKYFVAGDKKPLRHKVAPLLTLQKPLIALLTSSNDKRICNAVSKDVVLESMVEMTSGSYSFKDSSIITYYSRLVKMIEEMKKDVDPKKQKFLDEVIERINDVEQVGILLEARKIQLDPPKYKRKSKKLRVK